MRDQACNILHAVLIGTRRSLVGANGFRLVLVIGILAALAWQALPRAREWWAAKGAGEEEIPVLVAKRYIPALTPVRVSMAGVRMYPKDLVPPGALQNIKDLHHASGRALFIAQVAVPENQPLTRAILVEASKKRDLSSLLPLGRVAVSFQVDRPHGAGGWVRPGDAVAIFRTLPTLAGKKTTPLLFASAEVLAVNQTRLGEEKPEKKSGEDWMQIPMESDAQVITVSLNPVEANALIEAREQGPLTIALRALGDEPSWPGIR